MQNPFFKNYGPFQISDILNFLNLDNKNTYVDQKITDIKDLFTSKSNEITFFHSKKYKSIANNTKASFCITTQNLQDELPGLAGFRSIQSDPVKSLQFMTTAFGSELGKSENLFTSPLLRGGRVSKKDIINGYKYSESRRFHTLKEMYENIEAARSLGVPEYKIREKVKRKGLSKDLLENLFQGVYTPKEPSNFFVTRIGEINRDLNEKENSNDRRRETWRTLC